MDFTPVKTKIPRVSSGTVKAFVFILLVGITIAFWLYTQRIYSHVREFQQSVVKTQVQIYLSIIDPRSEYNSGIPYEIFETVVRKPPYPIIFTDDNLNPKQGFWHNVGIDTGDTTAASREKLKKLIKKMDKVNPPERYTILGLESRTDTLTVYEIPVGMNIPVAVTDGARNPLYTRNLRVNLADTLSVWNLINKIDLLSLPIRFQKEGEPTLIFHGLQPMRQWPVVIVKNGQNPLYWNDIGVSVYDTTAVGKNRLIEAIREIEKTGIVYNIVATHNFEVERIELFHYGDLPFLTLIGWLPVIELIVILILLSIGFIGLMNIKNAEQRSIWVGMAKETAHQLGTPISSLSGWLELLKTEQNREMVNQALPEIEYDIKRLTRVAARFSSIGSKPELKPIDLSDVIDEVLSYFRARLPRMGKSVVIDGQYEGLRMVMANGELLNWAFENLIKNSLSAIESMDGRISVAGSMSKDFNHVILDFKDNGKGISSTDQKKIMKPGYTTKKRGWGLGLSLVKRIIEDYHGGKIYLLETKVGEGATFRIVLPALPL